MSLSRLVSFLPTAINEWNNLPADAQYCNSVNSFKYFLNKDREKTAEYFTLSVERPKFCTRLRHPAGDVTRVSVMSRKVTVKIGDAENRCRGCRDKNLGFTSKERTYFGIL